MPTILVTLETLEPLLATSFQGDPNSDVSYDYIPGSMIRGALIGRYIKQNSLRELNLENTQINRLFFSDLETRYLNGYLMGGDRRSLPVPCSWHQQKGTELLKNTGLKIYDFGVELNEEVESPKPLSKSYFWFLQDGSVHLHRPYRRVNIHNQRDRTKGRSSKKENNPNTEGEVFRYDALELGQSFQAAILCEQQDVATFEKLLAQPDIWIGGSRSAGYGHVKLSYTVHNDESWQEVGTVHTERADADDLTVTLLSHTLLRDEWGQPTAAPALLPAAINSVLGSEVLPNNPIIFSSSTLIGGFNRKWGLPLPQVPALAAGSVLVFESGTLTPAQISQLERMGIGERRNEGFGRVAINAHTLSHLTAYKPEIELAVENLTIASSTAIEIATRMAENLLRQRLEHRLKKQLNDSKLKHKDGKLPISNSQLSRLGTAARKGLSQERVSLAPVSELLENLAKVATDQFKSAQMERGNLSFYEQLHLWIDKPTTWMGSLAQFDVSIGTNVNRKIEKDKEDDLAKEYTLRLVAAVAKQAYKENVQ